MKHLYINTPLKADTPLTLERNLARRLTRVLRFKEGQAFALFNGVDGLFKATLTDSQNAEAQIAEQLKPQPTPRTTTLYLALTKRDAFDRAVRQATEIGIDRIVPVQTEFAVPDKLKTERLKTIIQEAAEQCERLTLPELHEPITLKDLLQTLNHTLFWADESVAQENTQGQWNAQNPTPADGLFVGPEGGFSDTEKATLRAHANVAPVGLGQHILRVDTAVAVGLGRFFEHLKV